MSKRTEIAERGYSVPGAYAGRCYCGAVHVSAKAAPQTVALCHCEDCRRATGAPVGAFAAFAESDVDLRGTGASEIRTANVTPGATRLFCGVCGSPIAASYDYLPEQIYIPLGILDQAGDLAPEVHAHCDDRLPWLHIDDTAERFPASSRAALNAAAGTAASPSQNNGG